MPILVNKNIGETPLEVLKRLDIRDKKLSYAGRLDPMAEGALLVLVGDECSEENRKKFLGLDKEYEVEVLFGISTDTYDLLGIPKLGEVGKYNIEKFIGQNHGLKYPPFSSKTIEGEPLFKLFKEGVVPVLPDITGEIYSIEKMSEGSINNNQLRDYIHKNVTLVNGDFRQDSILKAWDEILQKPAIFPTIKLLVKCQSGVYMRSLANALTNSSLAYSIKRTKIGNYRLK